MPKNGMFVSKNEGVKKIMKILLLNSVETELYVALINGEKVEERVFATQRQHDRNINRLVREVMNAQGINFADLSAIAVVTGPGSWTGSRVGVVAAKAYALCADKPVIAVKFDPDRVEGVLVDRGWIVQMAMDAFLRGDFTEAKRLEPFYNGEFKIS